MLNDKILVDEAIEMAKMLQLSMGVPVEFLPQFTKAIYSAMVYDKASCGGRVILSILNERLNPNVATSSSYNEACEEYINKNGDNITCSHQFNLYSNRGDDPGDCLIERDYTFSFKPNIEGQQILSISARKTKNFFTDSGSFFGELSVIFAEGKVDFITITEQGSCMGGYYNLTPTNDPIEKKCNMLINKAIPSIDEKLQGYTLQRT